MSSFRQLVRADYEALYGRRPESLRRRRLMMPVRFLTNPSLHAIVMIRAALCGPALLFNLWRHVLLTTRSVDVERGCVIGPGLTLPHPFGLMVSARARIGARAEVYHNVCIGAPGPEGDDELVLGDDVVLYTNAVVMAGATVGDRVVVAANSVVDGHVPSDSVVKLGNVRPARGSRPDAQPPPVDV